MSARFTSYLVILFVVGIGSVEARVWTDATGLYTIEADLIGFNDDAVILQRDNKELGAFPLDKLSDSDREYLRSQEAIQRHADQIDKMQTWTSKDGLKVVGRVVDYAKRTVVIQRRRGKTYANNIVVDNLPEVYQAMLPMVIEQLERVSLPDKKSLDQWVLSLKGKPKSYELDGVIMEFSNGDEYGVPFFLFSAQDQRILKPGWDAWVKDHEAEVEEADYQKRDDHAFRLQSLAAAYRQNEQIKRQIAIMSLNMQAIQVGLTSAWEVTLYPRPGNYYPPRWVVVLARNSLDATQIALRNNPGFANGPVRKVSRR